MNGLFGSIVDRATSEQRYPGSSRVPYNQRTIAGVQITPDSAVTIATVWAALRYLSQTPAPLPWHVMRDGSRGAEIMSSHPVDWLLNKRPNPEWSSFQFRETLIHWALRWGNGYAEIEPDQLGRPFALWPIHPDRTLACRATVDSYSTAGDEIPKGALYYEVNNGTEGKVVIAASRMYHVRGFGEGPVGVNVIHYAAQSLGWARAAQLFGAAFFGNGMNPAGVVINKKPLKPEGLKRQKAEFEEIYKGSPRAHRTAFLDNDTDWKPISFNARESQLIDVHQHLVEEICRWFGVPPHKVMHLLRATFSNIEHQSIEVVVDSITPWVKRFEDEADFKLFGQNRQNLYTKINLRALLRGDFKSQNEGLEVARRNGVINADEWREYLDMTKMPEGDGGDKYIMQSNNTTLERIGEEVVVTPTPATPSPTPAPAVDPNADAAAQNVIERIASMLEPV